MYNENSSSAESQQPGGVNFVNESHTGVKPIKKQRKNKKKANKLTSSTYKTKKCEFYNRGACGKGAQCTFSHNFVPDVAKKLCKFFLSGSCTKGEECSYSHNTKRYPCKFYHLQKSCYNDYESCRFSHDEIEDHMQNDFLKDNEDFLVKLHKQDKLPQKYREYFETHNLLLKNEKVQSPTKIQPKIEIEKQSPPKKIQPKPKIEHLQKKLNRKLENEPHNRAKKQLIQAQYMSKEEKLENYYKQLGKYIASYY